MRPATATAKEGGAKKQAAEYRNFIGSYNSLIGGESSSKSIV
jgi:hypothetical protein